MPGQQIIEAEKLQINLQLFEGPLDLLLYLIRKNDLNVYDIPVALILDQYLAYLDLLKELNVDLAGEFILLASELAHIKSRMLLHEPDDEEPEGEDPRANLVARLLEYQKYKRAANWLNQRPVLFRDVFTRTKSAEELAEEETNAPEPELLAVDPFNLIQVFQDILKKVPQKTLHEIEADRISITDRIYSILDHLKNVESVTFESLFEGTQARSGVVVTFLAILEMARLKMIKIQQMEINGAIWVKKSCDFQEGATEIQVDEFNG